MHSNTVACCSMRGQTKALKANLQKHSMGPICISTQVPLNVRQQCKTPSCHAALSFSRERGTCYSRYDCSSMEIQPSAEFLPCSQLCCPRCIRRSKTKGKTYLFHHVRWSSLKKLQWASTLWGLCKQHCSSSTNGVSSKYTASIITRFNRL